LLGRWHLRPRCMPLGLRHPNGEADCRSPCRGRATGTRPGRSGCRWCPRSASGRGIRLPAVPVSCSCITVSDEGDQGERTPARRSVADSASLIELSRARRSGCSASCWPGCSSNVGVVTSCWKVASLELAFASVAGCRSRMTAHLRRSGTRPRSRARRSAAGCGCGIVIRERPPSAAFS
jgi:hypothetical protein